MTNPKRFDQPKARGGVGDFKVYHLGPMQYAVIDAQTGATVAKAEQFGIAYQKASHRHECRKAGVEI